MFGSKKGKDINLIPEAGKTIGIGKYVFIGYIIFGVVVAVSILTTLLVFSLNFNEKSNEKSLQNSISEKNTQWQKVASAAAGINLIKTKIKDSQSFNQTYPQIQSYLNEFTNILPQPVVVSSLDLDNSGKATVQIKSPKPDDAYQFINVLKSKPTKFTQVNIQGVTRDPTKEEYTVTFSLTIKP